jgi:hypothetical protein
MGTLTVFDAVQPEAFDSVTVSVTAPAAPAVNVMLCVFAALVIAPLVIDHA